MRSTNISLIPRRDFYMRSGVIDAPSLCKPYLKGSPL